MEYHKYEECLMCIVFCESMIVNITDTFWTDVFHVIADPET